MNLKSKLLLVACLTLILSACAPAAETYQNASAPTSMPTDTITPTPSPQESPAVALTDALGREIVLQALPQRIVIAGKGAQMILHAAYLFDEADTRIVAMEQRTQRGLSMIPLVDRAYGEEMQLERDAAAEAIASAHPDLVILKSYLADSLGTALEALGLPVVYLDLETPEQYFRDVRTLGALFGDPERAEEVLSFYEERLDRVSAACQGIPAEDRPRVLILQYTDSGGEVALNVPPASWLQTSMVDLACGRPVWSDAAGGGWTVVDFEQIAAWNPDQIFVIYYRGDPAPAVASLRADAGWAALRAVQSGNLRAFPGDYVSWGQPDPRWILGLEWLASRLLPEGAFPFDAEAELQAFYRELYGVDQAAFSAEVLPLLNGDYAP
jgi:iron complex transport system substrate-binding protein